jgi:trehalose 6-phosphate synthase
VASALGGYEAVVGNVLIEPVPARRTGSDPADVQSSRARRHDVRDLVVVAHRGPVRFATVDSTSVIERNGGGLVTALRDVMRHVREPRFVCAASTDEDRIAAAAGWRHVELGDVACRVRMLDLDARAQHDFYGVIANPLLWFVQHGLCDGTQSPFGRRELAAWECGYVPVNRAFARALVDPDDVPPGSVVMVHDYHFYLVPGFVRSERPDVFVHFFVHIPWPEPNAWTPLPLPVRRQIFGGLLGSDIVGFQTARDARNFLHGCEALLGLDVDFGRSSVGVGERTVAIRFYPISVDESSLREVAAAPEVMQREQELAASRAERLLVRVDRTDPSKNVVRGFLAFDRLLELHPDLEGRVSFLALLQPSRQDVSEYAAYLRDIEATAADINRRRGRPGWTPIDLRLGDDMALVVAAYKAFDVLMVNSVRDGMNLVCKEALLLNERDGVIALSEEAGAHEELGAIAVSLSPFDVEQQAHALYEALQLCPSERRNRHSIGVDIVRTNDVHKWLHHQLLDIQLMGRRRVRL